MKLSEEAQNWIDYLEVKFALEPHQQFLMREAARVLDRVICPEASP